MRHYHAVIFDMFDTLVDFRWDRLPLVPFDGGEVRSTSPLIYDALRPLCPGIARSDFCRAFIESSREVERTRSDTQREVTAHARFRRMGIGPDQAIFVGDTPEADVLGAQGVGMDVIWINRGAASLPPGASPPTHTVTRFAEVTRLV